MRKTRVPAGGRGAAGWPAGVSRLLLEQPDHPVIVAPAPVNDTEEAALAVVEQVEVMPHKLHLEQCLLDGHGRGAVKFLAYDERAVAFHLDGDEAHSRRPGGPGPAAPRSLRSPLSLRSP